MSVVSLRHPYEYFASRLTKLARIKSIEQLTQESPSIEELDVVRDTLVFQPTTRIPADLVTECSCSKQSATKLFSLDYVRRPTLDISCIDMSVPNTMTRDGDILAHIAGVEESRADELVAEERRLVSADH
jgi:hypothetical protein